ncbi:ead/Ea22-like family protein, partial [Escherichia coli]|nr:ead/Ea22-like family protein [Escherichia coli]EFK6648212.1 ead/Ea22-like family protein [Escherichia coli]EKM3855176.1 ead/Ea22-like family protein [Escherichia coli]EKY6752427.1 ead/Ea22-like family protein [Escherichia coli]EKZ8502831.1 ead/Ea22-like family protein [Escherichia coli]
PGGVIAECHVNCLVETDAQAYANAEFIAAFNPNVALALLDERERNQQYIKSRDQENEEIALTEGKLLIENGRLVADTLRHLADNEIDSDYFAITSTNENGTEIDHEMAITDYALQAAGTVDELVAALESAEKRIAELEAREISLPERSSMLHRTDFHDDYQTVMAYKVSEVIAAIRAAGIRIKGEEHGNKTRR